MGKNLVIVESPAKAKTIKKYLGKDFDVVASIGHIEDLPENKLGVDIDNDFQPEYTIMKGKKKVVNELKKLVKTHDKIYLATDEDREGEAIAWHLIRTLKLPENTPRITFHEITKSAIQKAIKNPRTINLNLVNAQQGRRILDRLVGYKISPILWKKIKQGLSAGRVQSVAVKLIVEKENEIKNFQPKQTWELKALLEKNISVILDTIEDKKPEFDSKKQVLNFLKKLNINNFQTKTEKQKISPYLEKDVEILLSQINIPFKLLEIKKSKSKRKPPAPFITSTLQQEASSKLGRGVRQVMQVAQKLYENGYITYMRTDDVSLSPEAIKQAEEVISSIFGKEYANPTQYKTKSKNAQEAHEAIRPTDLSKTALDLGLSGMEAKLYDLIWKRTLASQMKPAEILITTYIFSPDEGVSKWIAKGEVVAFDGFMKVYNQTKDEILPELKKQDILLSKEIIAIQKFSKAPSRYTESSLVKALEKLGIGRPSTYAAIISTIIQRGYIEKTEDKKLKPTEIAYLVVKYLDEKFPNMMDYKFTAKMEDELDKIAIGKLDYVKMLSKFWKGFLPQLENAEKGEKLVQKVGKKCPECGGELVYKFGKFGKFIACENYPTCKYKEQTEDEKSYEEQLKQKFEGKPCPAGGKIVVKRSKNGYFLASDKYPEIKWAMAPDVFELNEKYGGEKCDKCGKGVMVVKKGKRGYFLACDRYPECKNIKSLKIK